MNENQINKKRTLDDFMTYLNSKYKKVLGQKILENKCQILSPLDGILTRGTKVTIRCRIPHATIARISVDGIWLDEVPIKYDIFKQQINVPDYEVIVYAKFNNTKMKKTYDGLIRYTVEK